MKYVVEITDAFYYLIEVDADNEEHACQIAFESEQYNKKKYNETYEKVDIKKLKEIIY